MGLCKRETLTDEILVPREHLINIGHKKLSYSSKNQVSKKQWQFSAVTECVIYMEEK